MQGLEARSRTLLNWTSAIYTRRMTLGRTRHRFLTLSLSLVPNHHITDPSQSLPQFLSIPSYPSKRSPPPDLTHATLNFPENKGRAPELITLIDAARLVGADVTLDTYPYLPGCTTLASLLPSWASSGGPAATLDRLGDEAIREKIRYAIEVTGCDGGHGIPTNWECVQVSVGNIETTVYQYYNISIFHAMQ